MSYSGSTYYFNIPYMKVGDILNEEDEQAKAQIIDGLLYSATLGGSNCIIDDAVYTLTNTTSSNAILTLSADSESVVTGIVGKRIAVVVDPVTIQVARNSVSYVYLRTLEGIDTDPTSCEIVGLGEENPSDGMILLAIVDYSGDAAHLDTNTGKSYLTSIQHHIEDDEDPHGETLHQTDLEISGNLNIKEREVHGVIYEDITTNGSTGRQLTVGFTPKFVSVMPKGNAGYFYFNISGTTVTVCNSGSSGIDAVVRIEG